MEKQDLVDSLKELQLPLPLIGIIMDYHTCDPLPLTKTHVWARKTFTCCLPCSLFLVAAWTISIIAGMILLSEGCMLSIVTICPHLVTANVTEHLLGDIQCDDDYKNRTCSCLVGINTSLGCVFWLETLHNGFINRSLPLPIWIQYPVGSKIEYVYDSFFGCRSHLPDSDDSNSILIGVALFFFQVS